MALKFKRRQAPSHLLTLYEMINSHITVSGNATATVRWQ